VLRDTDYEVYKDEAGRLAHRETPHFAKYAAESADMFSKDVIRNIVTNVVPSDANWR
jgi:quinol monooxygenase YgiN